MHEYIRVANVIITILLAYLIFLQYIVRRLLLTPAASAVITCIVLPVYLSYPFAVTPRSLAYIGQMSNEKRLSAAVDEIWLVATLGFAFALLSYWLFPRLFPKTTRRLACQPVRYRTMLFDLTASACFMCLVGAALVWGFFLHVGQIPLLSGNPVYVRSSITAENASRYIYLGGMYVSTASCSFLTAGLALRRIKDYRPLCVLCVLAVLITNWMSVNRTAVLLPLMLGAVVFFAERQGKFTLKRAIVVVVSAYLMMATLQVIRHQNEFRWDDLTEEILYGNTNSGLRDSGWLLMNFEDHRYPYYYGKTLAAGLLSFIPSSVLPFRAEYSWGAVSLDLVHWEDRSSWLGIGHIWSADWYLNFGLLGVVVEGLLAGFVYRMLDERYFFVLSEFEKSKRYDYYTMFKIWFAWLIVPFFMYSGLSQYIYPSLVGLWAVLLVAALLRKALHREQPAEAGTWARAPVPGEPLMANGPRRS